MSPVDRFSGSSGGAENVRLADLEAGREVDDRPSWTCPSDGDVHYNILGRRPSSSSCGRSVDGWLGFVEHWLTRFTVALIPSFLQPYLHGGRAAEHKTHAIAALDGLRGWACLLVFNFHFLFTYTWKVSTGWGFAGSNFSVLQLPIVHLLVSGHVMVAIFFVISGYVLSYKPLKLVRSGQFDQASAGLASSTFRRGLRLYVPSIAGMFLVLLAVRAGVYNYPQVIINRGDTILGTNEQHPHVVGSFRAQCWDWYLTVVRLMDPWDWDLYYNNYNPHLWTIPVEFRSSIVLFVTLLATSRLRSTVRIGLVAGLVWFCVRWGRWDVVLFLSGMLLAEFDLINRTWEADHLHDHHQESQVSNGHIIEETESSSSRNIHSKSTRANATSVFSTRTVWLVIFLLGLYIGSSPNTGYAWTPGYMWLARLTPKTYSEPHRFPQSIGAVLIVLAITRSRTLLQPLFTHRISQYLGRISFAFYIVHGPILHSLGYSLMPTIWGALAVEGARNGKESESTPSLPSSSSFSNVRYCLGFLIGWCICLSVSVWAADLFWRYVDVPSVRFARWLEGRMLATVAVGGVGVVVAGTGGKVGASTAASIAADGGGPSS